MIHTLVGMNNAAGTMKNSLAFLKKQNMELPYTQKVHFQRNKTCVHTETCTQIFLVALFVVVENWYQLNIPWQVNGYINGCIHTMELLIGEKE